MSFDPRECWDCPVPMIKILLLVAVGLTVVVAGLHLVRRRTSAGRILGSVVLLLAALWYIAVSGGIWRFGVLWNSGEWLPSRDPTEWHLSRLADLALLFFWYAATGSIFLWRWRRSVAAA